MRSHIEGFAEAANTMSSLSKAMQRGVGTRALVTTASEGLAAVKAATPVSNDPTNPTRGSLRESGRVDRREKNRKGRPRVAILFDDVAGVPNEFGTSKMKAQPFFRPTIDRIRAQLGKTFGDALKGEVDAAVARVAKRKK